MEIDNTGNGNLNQWPGGCCRLVPFVQEIRRNPEWEPWKLDIPYYDLSDYRVGCGTVTSIFWCILCLIDPFSWCNKKCCAFGGCYFCADDLMRFANEVKIMTRLEALEIMERVNLEQLTYYSNHPEHRVKIGQSLTQTIGYMTCYGARATSIIITPKYTPYGNTFPYRTNEIREYELNLKRKGMVFVAYDLD